MTAIGLKFNVNSRKFSEENKMKKNKTALVLMLVLVSAVARAQSRGICADFTGRWSATCAEETGPINGPKTERNFLVKIELSQSNCQTILIDGKSFELGAAPKTEAKIRTVGIEEFQQIQSEQVMRVDSNGGSASPPNYLLLTQVLTKHPLINGKFDISKVIQEMNETRLYRHQTGLHYGQYKVIAELGLGKVEVKNIRCQLAKQ
jgi:hypothetical protein